MTQPNLRVLVTGAHGFIGRNLCVRLAELSNVSVVPFLRTDAATRLPELVGRSDVVVHLAGENRPDDDRSFVEVNANLTVTLCDAVKHETAKTGRKIPIILASSTQVEKDNPYGRSKLAAENAVKALSAEIDSPATIFRLPGVFGKWCRPNYNSVVATFCHNVARGLPVIIHDPAAPLRLVYVDDVVTALIAALEGQRTRVEYGKVEPEYATTVGDLAKQIEAFETSRKELRTERVGTGLSRALYATYVSSLPNERFSYEIAQHQDSRGVFVEMLKTPDSGQFSYLTAAPGVTRGEHYHHTKTEKFLVIRGEALFRFRHLITGERVELRTSGARPQIVETIPGWAHDISNAGADEMIVMLWANEIFDRGRPDTISCKV